MTLPETEDGGCGVPGGTSRIVPVALRPFLSHPSQTLHGQTLQLKRRSSAGADPRAPRTQRNALAPQPLRIDNPLRFQRLATRGRSVQCLLGGSGVHERTHRTSHGHLRGRAARAPARALCRPVVGHIRSSAGDFSGLTSTARWGTRAGGPAGGRSSACARGIGFTLHDVLGAQLERRWRAPRCTSGLAARVRSPELLAACASSPVSAFARLSMLFHNPCSACLLFAASDSGPDWVFGAATVPLPSGVYEVSAASGRFLRGLELQLIRLTVSGTAAA